MALTKQQIPTPALVVESDRFERNLKRMAEAVSAAGKKLRPHFKAHKCVEIARRQIAAGACGICAATVDEVEVLANAGIEGILLTSPLGDPLKIERTVRAGAMAVVDHARQVEWFAQAAEASGKQTALLVDLDVGDHRTGAAGVEAALELALAIDRSSHLWLRGVQAYSVSGSHGAGNSADVFAIAAAARDEMARHGLHTDIVSGGSTGSAAEDLAIDTLTELQAGSYALMDMAYKRLGVDFENAMTVLATVISANHEGFVTLDAGFKAFSTDRPFSPEPVMQGTYRWAGDEFGYLDGVRAQVGDRVELLPPHCDPTANLYSQMWVCRGDEVIGIWRTKV